jgi:hypothetical protein
VTGGLAGILFSNPYRETVFAEYASRIRCLAKEQKVEGTEQLNDRCLFEAPAEDVLRAAYQDVAQDAADGQSFEAREGVFGWLESRLGIVPYLDDREKEYRSHMNADLKREEYRDALAGKTYPTRLYPIKEVLKRKKTDEIGYMRHYPVHAVILMFFLFSSGGWLWEVALHLVQTGEFANRGFLHGPWLPIYGFGGMLVYSIFRKSITKPVYIGKLNIRFILLFIYICLITTVVELASTYIIELFGIPFTVLWDYSEHFMNFQGRICLDASARFGVLGLMIIYGALPIYRKLISMKN